MYNICTLLSRVIYILCVFIITKGAAFRLSEENFKDFTKLSKEYGDIFSLYIGSRLVVVLNGSDVIHEALVKNSTAFAGRPDLFSMRKASDGGRGIIHCNYGKKWQVFV